MLPTELCDIVGIEIPVIQAGMSIFTSPALAGALSNAGGLGSLGVWRRPADQLRREIDELRDDRPGAFEHDRQHRLWFVDTNYNEESFFVREAYFTGANDPYQSLRRALRADIDEAAWASLYRTESRPFPPPETGKIAVKVIHHYGDEVMKVYEVEG